MTNEISKEAQAAADKAKVDGHQPMYTVISAQEYVYRGITRAEWRDLLDRQNTKIADAGEDPVKVASIKEDEMENLVKAGLIYPDFEDNMKVGAGVVQSLADAVLLESGFAGPEVEPVRL
jgi:hypothetical protein